MSRLDKLKVRFLSRPTDFTYAELATLLKGLGYTEDPDRAGSRVAFLHPSRRHIIRLHKPHPGNVLKRYQIDQIIEELTAQEDLP